MGVIYLGPYGRLMQMDVPGDGFDSGMIEYGKMHESLNGTHTKDVFGWKRSFTVPLNGMKQRALSWFEMLYRGSVTGPYFLLDPRRQNRLHASIADTMSSYSRRLQFAPANGTMLGIPSTKPMLTSQLADSGNVYTQTTPGPSYAAQWTASASGVNYCGITPIPVIPGEVLIFSGYVVAGNPTFGLAVYATPSTAPSLISPAPVNDPTDATRKFIRYTVPADGSVQAVLPTIGATAAGTYTVLALQLEGQKKITDNPSAWVLGTGVPKVIVDDFKQHTEYLGVYTSGSLTLVEA